MSAPLEILSPIEAAKALGIARRAGGIVQLRVLLYLMAHPWPHTAHELAEALGMGHNLTWVHLTNLGERGFVEACGSERVNTSGPARTLYQVKGASSC